MSYRCQQCGSQNTNNSCKNNACPRYSHVHGSNYPYTGHSGQNNYCPPQNQMQASQNIVVHHGVHPNACGTPKTNCLNDFSAVESTGRPILSGIFEARDARGGSVPFAQVTITYTGTNNLVALFSDRNKQNALPNPATTDIYGRLPIYYGGGPIDILVEKTDSNGQPCGVVEKIFNEGGYVDSDFFLSNDEVKNCIDIEKPLFRIFDEDNCNLPNGMVSPKFALQWANWQSGLPIGTYSEVKEFFECIGIDFTCGVLVFGDSTGNRFRYDCENCTQTCPPDPETVDFNPDGTSECWIKLDEFSACIYDEVEYVKDLKLLGCAESGENVLSVFSASAYDVVEYDDQMEFLVNNSGDTVLTRLNRQNLSGLLLGDDCLVEQPANSERIDILRLADGSLACIEADDTDNCNAQTVSFPAFSPINVNGSSGFTSSGPVPFTATANPPVSTLDTAPPNTALFCFSDAAPASHTFTIDFGEEVDDAVVWIRSSTGAQSNFSNWSKAPDSVVPANNSINGSSGEDFTFTNINSQTLTATLQLAGGQRVCLEVKTITTQCP